MVAQLNINQDLQADMIYSNSAANYLSTAIIKDAQGRNIMIEWGPKENQFKAATTNQALSNMVSEPLGQKNKYIEKAMPEEKFDKSLIVKDDETHLEATMAEQEREVIKISLSKNEEETKEVVTESNKGTNSINNSNTSITTITNNTSTSDIKGSNTSNNNGTTHTSNAVSAHDVEVNTSNDQGSTGKERNIKTYYGISTTEAYKFQLGVGGKIQKNGNWITATASEIQQYFMPSETNIKKYRFQFLNLASLAGISEVEAKAYLNDKGILKGTEATFLIAAKTYNVNEIYLMAHACLETGNGKSELAQGVNYNGTTVYNMFGINAVDSDPIGQGAAYAYKMGWTTPEKAILGGAQFISTQYINNYPYNQDTLYEMRWNPASPGRHQYATDIAWATKQAEKMEKIYATFENATLTFDIPVYRK